MELKANYGISLDGVPKHHLQQFLSSCNKDQSSSRLKELQSAKKFYTQFPETQDVGLNWKKEYAKDANISSLIATFKNLEPKLNIHLHRICKTAYPLYVWISHYYEQLEPYLKTFHCIDIQNNHGVEPFDGPDPIKTAEEELQNMEYTKENIVNIAFRLGLTLSTKENPVHYITSVKSPDGEVILTPVYKRQNSSSRPPVHTLIQPVQYAHGALIGQLPPLPTLPTSLNLVLPPLVLPNAVKRSDEPMYLRRVTETSSAAPISTPHFEIFNTFTSISPEQNKPGIINSNDLIIPDNFPDLSKTIIRIGPVGNEKILTPANNFPNRISILN